MARQNAQDGIQTHSILAVATIFCVIGIIKIPSGPGHEVLCPLRTRLAGGRVEDRELLRLTSDHQAAVAMSIVQYQVKYMSALTAIRWKAEH